jgi:hypothetical protein
VGASLIRGFLSDIGVEFNLQDHAQILDLFQLLAHIHQPNGFEINFPDENNEDENAEEDDTSNSGTSGMDDVSDNDQEMEDRDAQDS